MNIHTNRVKTKTYPGIIKEQLLKKSQELFVLAFLKYIDSDKYDDITHSDRPDLQGKDIGIEVTTADPPEDLLANKEFAKFCIDHNDRRKETISKRTNKRVATINNIDFLTESGGYNYSDKKDLLGCIDKKIKSAHGYSRDYKILELAVIRAERPLQEWIKSLNDWIKPLYKEENPFHTIYIIFPNAYFVIKKGKDGQLFELGKETYEHLKAIGRMTAEGELTFDAEEWH